MDIINVIETDKEYVIQDKRVNSLIQKQLILIGDSYGTGQDSQGNQTISYMETLPKRLGNLYKCYTSAINGAGFVNGLFLYQLENITVENNDYISSIYVIGGYNDRNNDVFDITGKIDEFIAKANTLFPNAEVKLVDVAFDERYTERMSLKNVHQAYSYYSGYIAYNILHFKGLLQADHYHPNQSGETVLTSCLWNIITTNSYFCIRYEEDNIITPNLILCNSVDIKSQVIIYHIQNYIEIFLPRLSFSLKNIHVNVNEAFLLGYIDSNILYGLGGVNLGMIRCMAWINTDSTVQGTGTNRLVNISLDIQQLLDDNLKLGIMCTINESGDGLSSYDNVNAIVIPTTHTIVDSLVI